jgi:hypothetical protein
MAIEARPNGYQFGTTVYPYPFQTEDIRKRRSIRRRFALGA